MTTPTKPTALARRSLLAALATLPAVALHAVDATWNVDAAGTFSNSANWTAGGPPGATTGTTSTDIATFTRTTLTAARVVTFDAATNLAGITFNNEAAVAGRVFTVSASTLGALTPTLTLSSNAVIQNTGTGTAVSGANMLDVSMLLTGKTTFSNTYGNSVLNIGATTGASANSITTAADLGNVDLVLSGTSTGGNLLSLRLNQASGTTLRLVKEGTGTWQLNGPTTTNSTMTGGLLVRQGAVSIGRASTLPIGSGGITLGDNTTVAGDLRLGTGSNVTVSNAITVPSSSATTVIFERGGGSGGATFSGAIGIARDVVFRQGSTNAQPLTVSGAISGTGDVYVTTALAATGNVTFSTGGINHTGKFINNSSAGTSLVTLSGVIGSNVTEVVQNSATSAMAISNANNLFGTTTVSLGTLSVTGSGRLGTDDVTVSSGATLTLANAAAIADAASLFFGSTATVNLNFAGAETVNMLSMINGSYIAPGSYDATALNSYFGGSVFVGTGSLNVLSTIPEPSSFAALAGLAMLGFSATSRRARRY